MNAQSARGQDNENSQLHSAGNCGGLGLVTEGAMSTHEAKHAEVKDNEAPTLMAIRGLATLITK